MIVRDILPSTGSTIIGCDLSHVDESQKHWLRKMLRDRRILVFRDQKLSGEEQRRVLEAVGPIVPTTDGSGIAFVSNQPGGLLGTRREELHIDYLFDPYPLDAISLHALRLPDSPTVTSFADMTAAAADLTQEQRARLTALKGLHVFDVDPAGADRLRAKYPEINVEELSEVHPLLAPNPQT